MTEVIQVPCNRIIPGDNDRRHFDQAALEELAASIAAHGLAQPITLRLIASGALFQIVAGERRFRAISQLLKWKTIPAIIREMTDEEASAIMLVENTSREDLDPIEEANAYQARIARFSWTIDQVSRTAGVSADLVKRRLSLLHLAPEIQHLISSGNLHLGHAEAMTSLDHNRQIIALRILRENDGMPLSQFRHIVGELLAEQSQDCLFNLENFWIQQVQEENFPRRGRHAFTGAPTCCDLPPLEIQSNSENTAVIIDRFIFQLLEKGFTQEAAAVGTLYDGLVRLNFLSVPPQSLLLSRD